MTKFNKSLLGAAVVGALALSGAASAADLSFPASRQITYAKDLIVNNGTTIRTPTDLTLAQNSASDIANINALTAGDIISVKVTLTDNAKFDSTADAPTLVAGFALGSDFAASAGDPLTLFGTPYYSASGQELNFSFEVPAGVTLAAGAGTDFLVFNGFQVTNLDGQLGRNAPATNSVSTEVTVQNDVGVQILAGVAEIIKTQWGLETAVLDRPAADADKTIDVGAPAPKKWFAPDGEVGGSFTGTTPVAGYNYANLGGITIKVSEATESDGATISKVLNYSTVTGAASVYNVVGTAVFNLTLSGQGLSSYGVAPNNHLVLSDSATCVSPNNIAATVTGNSASFSLPATNPIVQPLTQAPTPSAASVYLCVNASGTSDLVGLENLKLGVTVDYKLPTQRVNPTLVPQNVSDLEFNGTTLIFQNVNPGGNTTAQSMLRLTNNNDTACLVDIDAKDDAGLHSDTATMNLGAHKSVQLFGEDLEAGNSAKGLSGGLGNGEGKWYVRVVAQCTNFKASALNRNVVSGTVTDLTAEKENGSEWLTPDAKLNP